jgi:hypothetical protein
MRVEGTEAKSAARSLPSMGPDRMSCSCRKRDCRKARPLCGTMRAKTLKYKKCDCGSYHFPHRRSSGACVHAKDAERKQWEKHTGTDWETGEKVA